MGLNFKLASFEDTVQHFNHFAMRTPQNKLERKRKSNKKIMEWCRDGRIMKYKKLLWERKQEERWVREIMILVITLKKITYLNLYLLLFLKNQNYIYIYIHIYICTHHHHIMLVARISLTLSRHSSLSFIALGRSSGQHPVSSHSCWMYVRAGRPAFVWPCVGISYEFISAPPAVSSMSGSSNLNSFSDRG